MATVETYREKLAELQGIPAKHEAIAIENTIAITDKLIDEVRRVKPKARIPVWENRGPDKPRDYLTVQAWWSEVGKWAKKHVDVDAFITPLREPIAAELERLAERKEELEEELRTLALTTVFERVPGAVIKMYTASEMRDGSLYPRAQCAIRVALLEARGFTAFTREVEVDGRTTGMAVFADARPEVQYALKSWRLDDVRLLKAVGAANLKVLFGPFFSYAGYWDWPVNQRETRDDESFAKHRASEDAHMAVNRQPVIPPPPTTPPPASPFVL